MASTIARYLLGGSWSGSPCWSAFCAIVYLTAPQSAPAGLGSVAREGQRRRAVSWRSSRSGASCKQGELHSWLLTLKTAAGQPVEGAAITIDGGMPQHGHGLPTSPEVTDYLGDGRYRIEGVKFTMSGWWQLRFAISAAAGSDSAVFNVVL